MHSTHAEQMTALLIGIPLLALVFGVLIPMAVRESLKQGRRTTVHTSTPAMTHTTAALGYTIPGPVFTGEALPEDEPVDYPGTWTFAPDSNA